MSEPAPVVSFDRSSPVYAYWLANCEGFRVRAGGRRGVVEEVELGATGHVARLVVGFGLGRRSVVTPDVVESVIPAKEVIVLRVEVREPTLSRLAPVVHASGRAASTTLHTSAEGVPGCVGFGGSGVDGRTPRDGSVRELVDAAARAGARRASIAMPGGRLARRHGLRARVLGACDRRAGRAGGRDEGRIAGPRAGRAAQRRQGIHSE